MKQTLTIVVGLITSPEGKIYLQKRHEPELATAHDRWELPGGKIDYGETAEAALAREIYEESGYTVKVGDLLPHPHTSVWDYGSSQIHTIVLCFRCTVITSPAHAVADHHVSEMGWFTQDEVSKLNCLPGIHEFIHMAS